MSAVREPAAAPQATPARDMELGHLFRGYECSDEPAPLGTPTYCGIRKVTARGALPFGSALCIVCDAVWRAERGLPPSPATTQEGEYARNQQEAVEHIRTLPPSERSAVANRPGQAPPSTPERA